jgi:hypothetical protein
MAGRNDAAIAAALQAVEQHPNAGAGANAEVRMLETLLRNHPPTFKGRYDPDGAQTWLKEIERVFRVMQCTEDQKVRFDQRLTIRSGMRGGVSSKKIVESLIVLQLIRARKR